VSGLKQPSGLGGEARNVVWVGLFAPGRPVSRSRAALVDPEALGRGFEVLMNADIVAEDLATVESFESRVAAMEEVTELRRMFGLPDYLIRVQVAEATAYEHWLTRQLLVDPAIARVDSRITMKVLKTRT
jgi:DNA-binding Lrp family transcriptional regulator